MLEYGLHRFLFHIDYWLPDRPFFLMLHFLLHGIHHYMPMDRYIQISLDMRCCSLYDLVD
jgi:4-hydroxysphinganine ceramide fatty acyl 2-hydroxylase